MFKQLLRWFSSSPAQPAATAAAPAADDERVLGCGWFDSSHDLVQGAHVLELEDEAAPLWRWAALTQA